MSSTLEPTHGCSVGDGGAVPVFILPPLPLASPQGRLLSVTATPNKALLVATVPGKWPAVLFQACWMYVHILCTTPAWSTKHFAGGLLPRLKVAATCLPISWEETETQ